VNRNYLIFGLLVALGIGAVSSMWWWKDLSESTLTAQLQEERATHARIATGLTTEKEALQTRVMELSATLTELTGDRDYLKDSLREEKQKVDDIEQRVGDALKTVGVLDKLSKTDAQLLQKYSKIYFLNEHYVPPKLTLIDPTYLYSETRKQSLHAQVMPFFEDMFEDALADGVKLYVTSAYRSFSEQQSLKGVYTTTFGKGANTFSADQGYSEHQLGTTFDITTTGINGNLVGFENTPAYTWLTKNAYKYGFTLSYPKNNTYYVFEPWHWRFVGKDLARKLHRDGNYFYDLDQRVINEYLISIFD